ncbi:MAG TPA: LysR family transcriptional regulator [Acidimicrobiales bacterium]|nr:LysR family transcriptional regulator [Acidimicrobiales bacterium]
MPLHEPVPDLRSLDLLRSVAELGSIRRAAQAHGVSQPAASTRLRSLERALGLGLLDRSSGRARLTAAGVVVVQWSETLLVDAQNLLVAVAAARSEGRTQLRIIASMTVAEYLVPEWLNWLRRSDPDAVVSLQMGNSEHVVEVMRAQGADIGFVEGWSVPGEFSSRVIQSDDLLVVTAPSHRWALTKRPIDIAEFSATPLVLREMGSGTREVLERELEDLGHRVIPLVEVGSTTAIKAAVASGIGPGVLSRLAVSTDLVEGRLVEVRIHGLIMTRSIRAIWSSGRPPNELARRLLKHVGTHLKSA